MGRKSDLSYVYKHTVDKVMVSRTCSPVPSECAHAADQLARASGITPPKGFNFVSVAEGLAAIAFDSGDLLTAGTISRCSGQGCGRFVKFAKENPTCYDCK